MKEPRFDLDYTFGVQGELLVADVLSQIADGQVRREVKTSRFPDTNLFVELEQNARSCGVWTPSGLNTSDSEYWAFVKPGGVFVLVPAPLLRWEAQRRIGRQPLKNVGGDNPTRGLLIPLQSLLDRAAETPAQTPLFNQEEGREA